MDYLLSLIPNVTFKGDPLKVALKKSSVIALHVRRRDTLVPHRVKYGYTFPNITYFAKSYQLLRKSDAKLACFGVV
jgi:hypothetical protein